MHKHRSQAIRARRLLLGCAVLWLLSPPAAHAQNDKAKPRGATTSRKKGKLSMQVQFVRAGGFAGPATRVAGTLIFDDTSAQVTSEGTNYRRDLPAPEAEALRRAVREAALDPVSSTPGSPPAPDSREYRITITAEDGKTRSITAHGDSAPSALLRWIQQEADSIWQYRLQHRP